jgi:polyvinyl alcohol dehydrogenase (cytochrome)
MRTLSTLATVMLLGAGLSLAPAVARAGVDVVVGDPKDWPMYNHDSEGTRWNHAETQLRPDNVSGLQVLWTLDTGASIAGTPAVVNDVVYSADLRGVVWAVSRAGEVLWRTQLEVETILGPKVTASPLVTNRTLVIGDLGGDIHGLDVATGAVRWKIEGDAHPATTIFSSGTMVGDLVAIGISSLEELFAIFPGYPCCFFRGAVMLLDPEDGRVVWKTYTISDEELAAGASGSGVWSTPTHDRSTRTVFATTGNNYTEPTTGTSDAFMAFDAATGAIKWVNQRTEGDTWNFRFPVDSEEHPDFDIGDSPQIYKVGGRTVVGAGQKSGFYHAVDALTGEIINEYQASPPGLLGGLFADSAVIKDVVYANGSHWLNPLLGAPPLAGSVTAVKGDASGELWTFDTAFPVMSGVAAAGDVLYFTSIDGNLYAVDARTGAELARVFTGGESSGPSVSRGRVYVGTGIVLQATLANPFADPPPGSLVALGLPE